LLQTNFDRTARGTNDLALPDGKIAIWVQTVTPVQAASHFHVGDDVAIFSSYTLQTSGGSASLTKVLLAPIKLLAVSPVGSGLLVSVGVSQTDAEALLQAKNRGTISVGLLSDTTAATPDGG
jgi:hypothetical protein